MQLFDSWVGSLTVQEYVDHAQEHSAAVLAAVADLGLPRVHFGTRSRHLLTAMRDAGADVVGVDAQTPIDEAVALLGGDTPVQGNIDPALLDAPGRCSPSTPATSCVAAGAPLGMWSTSATASRPAPTRTC